MLCVRRRSKIQSAQKRTVISIYLCAVNFFPLTEDQLRQLIDAEACFVALEQARQNAKAVRGSMFWLLTKAGTTWCLASPGGQRAEFNVFAAVATLPAPWMPR